MCTWALGCRWIPVCLYPEFHPKTKRNGCVSETFTSPLKCWQTTVPRSAAALNDDVFVRAPIPLEGFSLFQHGVCACALVCLCVCPALNLMKGIFCSSQSQVIFTHTHTHTHCHCAYAHRDTTYMGMMVALKRPHMYSHSDVCSVYMSTRSKSAKASVHAQRLPVVHPSKSFSLSSACENIHCSRPMRWLFQDHDGAVWKDQVNSARSFLQILYFKWTAQLLNRTCLCFRSLGHPLWIPTEKSMVMRSAFRNPASPTTVETPLTSMLQWRISSRTQSTASPCWPVPRVAGTRVDVPKVCPLQRPRYPQSPTAWSRCPSWLSASLSSPFPGDRQGDPMDPTSG